MDAAILTGFQLTGEGYTDDRGRPFACFNDFIPPDARDKPLAIISRWLMRPTSWQRIAREERRDAAFRPPPFREFDRMVQMQGLRDEAAVHFIRMANPSCLVCDALRPQRFYGTVSLVVDFIAWLYGPVSLGYLSFAVPQDYASADSVDLRLYSVVTKDLKTSTADSDAGSEVSMQRR